MQGKNKALAAVLGELLCVCVCVIGCVCLVFCSVEQSRVRVKEGRGQGMRWGGLDEVLERMMEGHRQRAS